MGASCIPLYNSILDGSNSFLSCIPNPSLLSYIHSVTFQTIYLQISHLHLKAMLFLNWAGTNANITVRNDTNLNCAKDKKVAASSDYVFILIINHLMSLKEFYVVPVSKDHWTLADQGQWTVRMHIFSKQELLSIMSSVFFDLGLLPQFHRYRELVVNVLTKMKSKTRTMSIVILFKENNTKLQMIILRKKLNPLEESVVSLRWM